MKPRYQNRATSEADARIILIRKSAAGDRNLRTKTKSDTRESVPDLESVLEELNRKYIFVRNPVCVLCVGERDLYRVNDFRQLLANRFALDGQKAVRASDAWLTYPRRSECTKLVYDPAQLTGKLQDGSFNLYRPSPIEPREGDIGPWRRLLDHVFRGAQGERRWFEQWVAYPLVHLGTKLFTAVVLWGEHGAGKSLLGETIGTLYGENYSEPSQDDLMSQFNEWVRFRQFALINEIVSTGRRPDADKLKVMITREYVTINRKYQPQFSVRDCMNYLITSNHPDAVLVEDSERRYFIRRVRGRLDAALADEVRAFKTNPEGRAALLHHLLREVDLQGFAPRAPAPDTSARRDMVEASISDLDGFIREVSEQACSGKRRGTATAEELKGQFEAKYGCRTSVKAVTIALQQAGAENLGQKREAGKRGRFWGLVGHRMRRVTVGEDLWRLSREPHLRRHLRQWEKPINISRITPLYSHRSR